jgi:hypothetical protein
VSTWHRDPEPPPQREWCRWHAGWVLERDAVLVRRIPSGEGMDYGQYACAACAEEHGILPADDSGEIRYGAAEAIPR